MIENVSKGEKITATKQNQIIDAINNSQNNYSSRNYNLNQNIERISPNPNLFQVQIQKGYYTKSETSQYYDEVIYLNLGDDTEMLKSRIRVNNTPVDDVLAIHPYTSSNDKIVDDTYLNPTGEFDKGYIAYGVYKTFQQSEISQINCDVIRTRDNSDNILGHCAVLYCGSSLPSQRIKALLQGVTKIDVLLHTVIAESTPSKSIPSSSSGVMADVLIQKHLGDINIWDIKVDSEMSCYLSDDYENSKVGYSIDKRKIDDIEFIEFHDFTDNNKIPTQISVDSEHNNRIHLLSGDGVEMENISFVVRNKDDSNHPVVQYLELTALNGLSGGGGESISGDASTPFIQQYQHSIETKTDETGKTYHQLYDFDDGDVEELDTKAKLDQLDIVVRDNQGLKEIKYRTLVMKEVDVIVDAEIVKTDTAIKIKFKRKKCYVLEPKNYTDLDVNLLEVEKKSVVYHSDYSSSSHEFTNHRNKYLMIKPLTEETDDEEVFHATAHSNEHHSCLDFNS